MFDAVKTVSSAKLMQFLSKYLQAAVFMLSSGDLNSAQGFKFNIVVGSRFNTVVLFTR